MQVGVRQRSDLPAVGTLAARIAVMAMMAAKVLHIGHGKGEGTRTRLPCEELGMAHPPCIDTLHQMPFQILLSRYICKTHIFYSFFFFKLRIVCRAAIASSASTTNTRTIVRPLPRSIESANTPPMKSTKLIASTKAFPFASRFIALSFYLGFPYHFRTQDTHIRQRTVERIGFGALDRIDDFQPLGHITL